MQGSRRELDTAINGPEVTEMLRGMSPVLSLHMTKKSYMDGIPKLKTGCSLLSY